MGRHKKLRRTTVICIFLAAMLAGLFTAKFTAPLAMVWLVLLILLAPLLFGHKLVLILYVILAGLVLGWWRGGVLQAQNQNYQELYYQKVEVTGHATEDSYYADKSQLEFMIESVSINGQKMPGKIQIKGFGEAMVYRHDIVDVTGKLYPAEGSKQANISFATINVTTRAKSSVDDMRRKFIAGMENALPEPAASFAVGLLVGQKSLLSADVAAVLVTVGLTHIVTVSGYNLTIIVRAVTRMLKKLSRFQILAASLFLIYLFLLVTGFSPSIIRATIVSVLSLLAWYFGRPLRPGLLILLAAALTGFINPYYIWGDIGWYLSFLAFFGVLILSPLFTVRIFANKTPPIVVSVAIESFCAQIMTLPLIMMIFGRVSVVGLLANILVVPFVPLAMLLAVISGLSGMMIPAIAGWIAFPARILLDIILWLTAWLSKWPAAQVTTSITAGTLVLLYVVIIVFVLGLNKRALSVKIRQRTTNKV